MSASALSASLTSRLTTRPPNDTHKLTARALAAAVNEAAALLDRVADLEDASGGGPDAYADGGGAPGTLQIITRSIADAADGNLGIVLGGPDGATYEVVDVWAQKRAADGSDGFDLLYVKNSGNNVIDPLNMGVVDRTIVRATKIDDMASTFAEGNTITIAWLRGGNIASRIYIALVRRT